MLETGSVYCSVRNWRADCQRVFGNSLQISKLRLWIVDPQTRALHAEHRGSLSILHEHFPVELVDLREGVLACPFVVGRFDRGPKQRFL